MPRLVLLLICLGAFCFPRHLHGQLIVNGGFEAPALSPGSFLTITPGTEPGGFAWTVLSGSVDVGYTPILPFVAYPAYQGNQALDLNGVNRGAIFQNFATVIGQSYTVSFAYADNPDEGGVKSASVVVTNVANSAILMSDNIFHSTSTNTPPNADWFFFGDTFIATGTTTRLTLTSTSASNTASGGIFIDALSVAVAVPEPSSLLLLGSAGVLGVSATTYWKRRRKLARR